MTLNPDAIRAEMARLRAENEAIERAAKIAAFLVSRKQDDVWVAPDTEKRGKQPSLKLSGAASADAWAHFRPKNREELTLHQKEELAIRVERQHILARQLPRRERG